MKLQIMSDLHLEFGTLDVIPKAETLILAGDVGLANKEYTFKPFLESVCSDFKNVIMILGNHEHYNGNFTFSTSLIKDAMVNYNNFHLLDNSSITIDDVTFIGSTLWANIDPRHEVEIMNGMNDFRIIEYNDRTFTTQDFIKEFNTSLYFIEKTLAKVKGKIVMITHHSPTTKAPEEYRGSSLNSAYGSNLSYLMQKYKMPLWIHGHTHLTMDYKEFDTRVICNPRGYYRYDINRHFNSNLTLEI